MSGKNKKTKITHPSITTTLGEFYTEWDNNPNEITAKENIIITDSSFENQEHSWFSPKLCCSNLVIHNCSDINSENLRYIIESCSWDKMRKFTISFDEKYTSKSTIDEREIDNIFRIAKTEIEGLSHVQQLGARENLTFTCNGISEISPGNQRSIYDYASNFNIILNDSVIEPFSRSVA